MGMSEQGQERRQAKSRRFGPKEGRVEARGRRGGTIAEWSTKSTVKDSPEGRGETGGCSKRLAGTQKKKKKKKGPTR